MDLVTLSKKYQDSYIAQAIINAIPYAGGSIDSVISKHWNDYYFNRLERLIIELINRLDKLEESQINKEYLQSEEFLDILLEIVPNVGKNRCPEKEIGFASLLVSAITREQPTLKLEVLIDNLINFKERDFLFIHRFNEYFQSQIQGNKEAGINPSEAQEIIHIDQKGNEFTIDDTTFMCYRFVNMGLLDYARNTLVGQYNRFFKPTNLFYRTIECLKK